MCTSSLENKAAPETTENGHLPTTKCFGKRGKPTGPLSGADIKCNSVAIFSDKKYC